MKASQSVLNLAQEKIDEEIIFLQKKKRELFTVADAAIFDMFFGIIAIIFYVFFEYGASLKFIIIAVAVLIFLATFYRDNIISFVVKAKTAKIAFTQEKLRKFLNDLKSSDTEEGVLIRVDTEINSVKPKTRKDWQIIDFATHIAILSIGIIFFFRIYENLVWPGIISMAFSFFMARALLGFKKMIIL